ncbi:CDA7-like protein [Mya arenaria]|uniref:CDA7-like protein n=1 Tax=Mya arenaria TaxID=6604 RepID=A0ABY7E3M5_MYAAR|nr:chitin deacetylase 7-like [Mya arenaria]XP_052804636.1 chitin deacetylase 7-like [Mya arenaria]WAR04455.1 CDA7-like protein [Mya arenaria]
MRMIVILLGLLGSSFQQSCDPTVCTIETNCRCYNDPTPPGGLTNSDIPQIVMLSFEGTINTDSSGYYNQLLGANNPNGCPITATFFIQDDGSDYKLVKKMYDNGSELGVNSLKGTAPKSSTGWIEDIKGVVQSLTDVGVKPEDIQGIRVPQLQVGGTDQFIGMGSNGLTYDSSCSNVGFSSPSTFIWPYTLDFVPGASCDNGDAPDKPFKGVWEFLIADYHDLSVEGLPCVVPSGCRNITTKRAAFDLFFNSFTDHYNGGRTPFNMLIDPAFAANQDLRDGTIEFLQYIRAAFGSDVWIVSIQKALQWIKDPTPLANLTTFAPWSC